MKVIMEAKDKGIFDDYQIGTSAPYLCGADKPYLKIGPEHFFPTTTCQLLLTPAYPVLAAFPTSK
jgi:hypothetical protein